MSGEGKQKPGAVTLDIIYQKKEQQKQIFSNR